MKNDREQAQEKSLSAAGAMSAIRFDMSELAGSLGDLGIFLPIAAALIVSNHLSATAVLAASGLLYIVSGLYFRVPIPVQPLKATAAIALATGASAASISAAAIVMGGILLFLAYTGAGNLVARYFEKPVIRGIQLSLGILLLRAGWQKIVDPKLFFDGGTGVLPVGGFDIPAGIGLAAISGLILLLLYRSRRIPASLAIVLFGIGAGILLGSLRGLSDLTWGPSLALATPTGDDFRFALLVLVLPQIPLTFGNSILATTDVAQKYFGQGAERVKPASLCASLGIANLLAGLAGAMPMCHGSGGITAHHRFGARTGGATVIIGTALLALALVFGDSATVVLGLIPLPVLGVMLFYIGAQHAWLIGDMWPRKSSLATTLAVAIVSTLTGTLIWGLLLGLMITGIKTLVLWLPSTGRYTAAIEQRESS
ncbi:MAG: putative sulfate/molybdate transporter [Thermoleophilia bacterium]